ncbi:hypothetical protein B0H14DRAFT_3869475 [Mycena olivaceomarginata]|nr:hypothetical protein B0H14DRAFT_3869475 [Mycena olivaceomarginata]
MTPYVIMELSWTSPALPIFACMPQMALEHLLEGLLEFATNEQGSKSVVKALKEDEKKRLNRVVQRMCDLAKGARCATMTALSRAISV